MDHRLIDRFGFLALVIYVVGALSFYPSLFSGQGTEMSFTLLLLLPPATAAAATYEFLRRRKSALFVPRRFAAAALGAGLAAYAAWNGISEYLRSHPPDYLTGADQGSEVFLPYLLYLPLCGLASLVAAAALPWLIRGIVRPMKPDPIPEPVSGDRDA